MDEIVVLGSGSGFATAQRFSGSIALLIDRSLYLFDCGEPCASLLFRNHIDVLALKTVFVSHMHPDHVGGLASLLSAAYLLDRRGPKFRPWSVSRDDPWYRTMVRFPPAEVVAGQGRKNGSKVTLMLPQEALEPVRMYLPAVYLAPSILPFDLEISPIQPGVIYDNGVLSVYAIPNSHLTENPAYFTLQREYPKMTLESYSFEILARGRKIMYSGDITRLEEVRPFAAGADVLLLEVAHYDPSDIGPLVRNLSVRRVILTHIHPGLEQLLPDLVKEWSDPRIEIAHDGMRVSLN